LLMKLTKHVVEPEENEKEEKNVEKHDDVRNKYKYI
jgi:hypothetical protein